MKHIKVFNTTTEMNDIDWDFVDFPFIYAAKDGGLTAAAKKPAELSYLTFTAEENTSISLSNYESNAPVIYYKKDGMDEYELWDYTAISLTTGQKVRMYGDNESEFNSSSSKYSNFSISGNTKASGSVMTLIDKNNPLVIPCNYCFYQLFNNCSSLTTAPELPATTLYNYCYSKMFYGCSSLTTAPELPATTLADNCYEYMFRNCTSLTTAPELPATTLPNKCYYYMFNSCTSLTSVTIYGTEFPISLGYSTNMFNNITTTGTLYVPTSVVNHAYYTGIKPANWTIAAIPGTE